MALDSVAAGAQLRCVWRGGVGFRNSQEYGDKVGVSCGREQVVEVEERDGEWVRTASGWLPLHRQSTGEAMFKIATSNQCNRASSVANLSTNASSGFGARASIEGAKPPAGAARASENIQVFARFRPLSDMELSRDAQKDFVDFGDDGQSCTVAYEAKDNLFRFSQVFSPVAEQDDVFQAVGKPIVENLIKGFNCAIIAYGQTGSGKTHTMVGPRGAQALIDGRFDAPDQGLIPRVLLELQAYAMPTDGAVSLRVSYLEVYQEQVLDLLHPNHKVMTNKMFQDSARGLWLPDVTEMPVQTAAEALEIMRSGNKVRAKAATEMNSDSSRSHAIFIVTVLSSTEPGKLKHAQLYLVDLAGSERTSKTSRSSESDDVRERAEETRLINRSLLALGQVIDHLSSNSKHVPYRDSKLTRLLQNCLGGNARTSIIVTASPHFNNVQETLSTLRFGDRASMIQNQAKVNISVDTAELKRQLQQARDDLADLRGKCIRLEHENHMLRGDQLGIGSNRLACVTQRAPMASVSVSDCSPELPAESDYDEASSDASSHTAAAGASAESNARVLAQRLVICELLPSLLCPLTGGVMREPVFAMDGYSYERSAIEQHLRNAGRLPAMSPTTGMPLPSKQVVPNVLTKQLIQKHMPDLPPLQVKVAPIVRIGPHKLELVFDCLDARSLGRSLQASTSFLAVGSEPRLWRQLLSVEFNADVQTTSAKSPNVDARKQVALLWLERNSKTPKAQNVTEQRKSAGLHLFSPPKRPGAAA